MASSRWSQQSKLPKVEFSGSLTLGEMTIPCAVLSDGSRVLSENGITNAILGGRSGASKRKKKAAEEAGALLPLFIAPKQLESFITKELREGPLKPISYREGNSVVTGYDVKILRAICEVWLAALGPRRTNFTQYLHEATIGSAECACMRRAIEDEHLLSVRHQHPTSNVIVRSRANYGRPLDSPNHAHNRLESV